MPARNKPKGWLAAVLTCAMLSAAYAEEESAGETHFPTPRELRSLTIEELLDMRITAAARRPEPVRATPSAVSVVTRDDIHRSGVKNVPDALRLATGVHVARTGNDTNPWAVGVRGGNLTTTNKLLVLQDGRSLYSPLFAGVFWDVQNPLLQDVERIEVIRGPGATLWGANAVNGVISIVTRNAQETQGAFLSGGAGRRERGFAAARYGGRIGEHTWYRVYGTGWDREEVVLADGRDADSRRRLGQGGFRVDSEPAPEIAWTLQGDLYDGRFERPRESAVDVTGGNILGRWTQSPEEGRHVSIQAYYDRVERDIPDRFGEKRDTFDAEFQHRFPGGERHDLMWGGNIRVSLDQIQNSDAIAFRPDSRTIRLFSLFVQDEIVLVPQLLRLTAGSKFEDNSYSGFEYQPSVRLAWTPTERQTVWAAFSRAVRTPSRLDTDVIISRFDEDEDRWIPTTRGNPDFDSEHLFAWEAGYRVRPADPVVLDLAVFYHDLDRLRSLEPDRTGPADFVVDNRLRGRFFGAELSVNYQVSEWWRIRGGYSHLQRQVRTTSGSEDNPSARGAEGNDPRHILFAHSAMNIGEDWTLDGVVRHVSSLPNPAVPAYTELDLRLAYFVTDDLEVSVAGENLLDSHHREFGTTHAVPRSVFFRLTWGL